MLLNHFNLTAGVSFSEYYFPYPAFEDLWGICITFQQFMPPCSHFSEQKGFQQGIYTGFGLHIPRRGLKSRKPTGEPKGRLAYQEDRPANRKADWHAKRTD